MQTIDKTQLPGKYKAWMYQHGLLPRHLRRRLGVPPSFTYIGLYGKTTKLQLPLFSVLEEFKVSKTGSNTQGLQRPIDTTSRNRDKNRQKVVSEPSY